MDVGARIGVDGFRIDAIKHISSNFFSDWIDHLEQQQGRDLFVVGEYWTYNLATLSWYAANTNGRMHLFDAPLHLNFHSASKAGGTYDMRRILDGSLMQSIPLLAVTLVENHDTQPLQALESVVEDWFKPLAYAIILLRREGYPCIFHADYYGASYRDKGRDGNEHDISMVSHRWIIDRLSTGPHPLCLRRSIRLLRSLQHHRLDPPRQRAAPPRPRRAAERWARRPQMDGRGPNPTPRSVT